MLKRIKEWKNSRGKGELVSDEIWKWLVLVLAIVVMCIRTSLTFGIGIIIAELKRVTNSTMTELIIIGSLPGLFCNVLSFMPLLVKNKIHKHPNLTICVAGNVVMTLGCLLSSLVDKPTWLLLTYSVVVGFGSCFSSIGSVSAIGEYFPRDDKHFILATSLITLALPISKVVLSPLYYLVIDYYSWRGNFIFIACCILFIGVPCALTFVQKAEKSNVIRIRMLDKLEKNGENSEIALKTQKSYKSMQNSSEGSVETTHLTKTNEENQMDHESKTETNAQTKTIKERNKKLWRMFVDSDSKLEMCLYVFGMASISISIIGFNMILPHFMVIKSLSNPEASMVYTSLGVCEVVSMLIAASIGNLFKGKLIVAFLVAKLLLASLLIGIIFVSTFYEILILSMGFGFLCGIPQAYILPCTTEVIDMPTEVSWAFSSFGRGFGMLFVPLLTGTIFDIQNNYDLSFVTISLVLLISACFDSFIYFIKIKKSKKKMLLENE